MKKRELDSEKKDADRLICLGAWPTTDACTKWLVRVQAKRWGDRERTQNP